MNQRKIAAAVSRISVYDTNSISSHILRGETWVFELERFLLGLEGSRRVWWGGHSVGKANTERRCVVYGKSGIKNFWRSRLLLRSQEEELLKGRFFLFSKKIHERRNERGFPCCVCGREKKYFEFEFDAPCFRAYVRSFDTHSSISAVGVRRGQGGRKAAGRKLLLLLIPFFGK